MTVDDDLEAIRRNRRMYPDSAVARQLIGLGLADEVASRLQALEIATRSLTAAFDGELDGRSTWWLAYLQDKAGAAERAARMLGQLAALAAQSQDVDTLALLDGETEEADR